MPRTVHVMLMAVRLDWRLAVAAARAEPGGAVLSALAGALFLGSLSESAMGTALLVQANPALATAVLAMYAWTTVLLAAGLTFVVGQHATAERLTLHLRSAPVSRPQIFGVLQALTVAGRHLGSSVLVSIPLGLLVVTLLPLHRAAAVGGAWLAILWMLPALIRVVSAVLRNLSYRMLFVLVTAAVAIAALSSYLGVGPALLAALPPGVMVRIATDGSTAGAWLLLVGWATLVWFFDLCVLSWRETGAPARTGSSVPPAIPWWSRTISRLCRVPPVLLHAEFLRLIRWRRFTLGWIVGTVIVAMFVSRVDPASEPILLHVILLCVHPWLAGGVLANILAPDRAGVQAYFLCVPDLRAVLRAKCVAVGVLVTAAQVLTMGLILLRGGKHGPAYIYAPLTAAGLFVWLAAVGLVTSVLFAKPTDPRRVGGGSTSAPAAAVMLLAGGFMGGLIVAGALLHDTGRAGSVLLMTVAAATIVLAGMAARLLPRVAHRLLHTRRERLTMELGISTTVT